MFGEGMVQRAHSLGSVSRPTVGEMQPRPILDEYRKREAATRALCPFGRCRFLPLGRRVPALCYVPHDRGAASRAFDSESAEQEPSGTRHFWPLSVYWQR